MFKENFERICAEKGLSPTSVCIKVGISKSNYSNWDNTSVPRKTTLIKIANELNVSVDALTKSLLPPFILNNNISDKNVTVTPHFIAYLDFLGIKEKIRKNEISIVSIFNKIYSDTQSDLNSMNKTEKVNIKYKVFSDNMVFAFEKSDDTEILKNQLKYFFCFLNVFQFFTLSTYKIALRGGITCGDLYMDNDFIIGKALEDAYYLENCVAIYPRIVINPSVIETFKTLRLPNVQIWKTDIDGECYIDYLNRNNKKDNFKIANIIDDMLKLEGSKIPASQKLNWIKNYNNSFLNNKISQKTVNGNNFANINGNIVLHEEQKQYENTLAILIPLISQMNTIQKTELCSYAFTLLQNKIDTSNNNNEN